MKLDLGNKHIQLYFTQDPVEKVTSAKLVVNEMTFFDEAFCHPRDNFVKEQGRKIALKKIFKDNDILTKQEKREIWKLALPRHNIN